MPKPKVKKNTKTPSVKATARLAEAQRAHDFLKRAHFALALELENPDIRRLRDLFSQTLMPNMTQDDKQELIRLIKSKIKDGTTVEEKINYLDLKYLIEKNHPGAVFRQAPAPAADEVEINIYSVESFIDGLENEGSNLKGFSKEELIRLQQVTYEYLYKNNFLNQTYARSQSDEEVTHAGQAYLENLGPKALTKDAIESYGFFLKKLSEAATEKDALVPQFEDLVENKFNKKRIAACVSPEEAKARPYQEKMTTFLKRPSLFLEEIEAATKILNEIETTNLLKNHFEENAAYSKFKFCVELLNLLNQTRGKVSFMGGKKVDGLKLSGNQSQKFPHHAAEMLKDLMKPGLSPCKFRKKWEEKLGATIEMGPEHGTRDKAVQTTYQDIKNKLKTFNYHWTDALNATRERSVSEADNRSLSSSNSDAEWAAYNHQAPQANSSSQSPRTAAPFLTVKTQPTPRDLERLNTRGLPY